MAKQKIESTKPIKFLDEQILFAQGNGKNDKVEALQRCRQIMYGYYSSQSDKFEPEETEVEANNDDFDLFGESTDTEEDLFS